MTDLFAEDEMPMEAELASAALDGELLYTEIPNTIAPEVAAQLASFRALSARLSAVEDPPLGAIDRAVAAALAAWTNLETDRPTQSTADPATTQPATKTHRAGSLSSPPPRRQSRHGLRRWATPGVSALAVLAVIALGVSAITRSNGGVNNEAASQATTNQIVKGDVKQELSATTTAPSGAMDSSMTTTTSAGGALGSMSSAESALESYLRQLASGLPGESSVVEAATPAASTVAKALVLCGQEVAAFANGPNGGILVVDTTDPAGARRVKALDAATCAILAELNAA